MSSRMRIALVFCGLIVICLIVSALMTPESARDNATSTSARTSATAPENTAAPDAEHGTAAHDQDAAAASLLSAPQPDRSATASLSLITEPAAGTAPLISMIDSAKESIDLVMYELEDMQIERALAAAEARGVAVRVLLNGGYHGKPDDPNPNASAYAYLESAGVPVEWTPSYFALTHQKTLVADGDDALIMTFNLTPQYYATSRDFGIRDTGAADVAAIEAVFSADWNSTKTTALGGDDLVWSPGSEAALLALINNARSSLRIYNEEMGDSAVTSALAAAAERGVDVEIDMTYDSEWKSAFDALVRAGAHVRTYASEAPLYIHAKMLLADGTQAFVGSENFSPASLDDNRELGIVLSDPAILQSLASTFSADWQDAQPYSPSISSGSSVPAASSQAAAAAVAYYASSYRASKYYYPASCSAWQGLSPSYLTSFPSLPALLAAYPGRTLSPSCQ